MAFVKYQLTAPQVEDANGDPLVGGSITAYLWDTSTPTPMYTNAAGDGADTSFTLNTLGNPQTDAGTAIDIFLDTAITYKFIIRDSAGTQVGPTIGPVYPAGGSGQTAEFASLEEFRASSFSGSEAVILAANAGTTTGRMILKATGTSAGTPTLTAARFTALAGGEIINAGGYGFALAAGQTITPYVFGFAESSDETTSIALAISYTANRTKLYWPAATYSTDPITVPTGADWVFSANAIIAATSGYGANDRLLTFDGCTSATLECNGAIFRMLKAEYLSGEQRHCFDLRNCSKVRIYDPIAKDSGGDGYYIFGATDCYIRNPIADNNRRNGMSIVKATRVTVDNPVLMNSAGTDPQCGLDFEPSDPAHELVDVVVNNPVMTSNAKSGLIVYLDDYRAGAPADISVTINNPVCRNNGEYDYSFSRIFLDTGSYGGYIQINNPVSDKSAYAAIRISDKDKDAPLLVINNPTVIDPCEGNAAYPNHSAIFISDTVLSESGGIHISDVKIKSENVGMDYGVYLEMGQGLIDDVRIGLSSCVGYQVAPVYWGNITSTIADTTDAIVNVDSILDEVAITASSTNITALYHGRIITNKGAVAGTTYNLREYLPPGNKYRFKVLEAQTVTIDVFNAADRIVGTTTAGASVTSNVVGAECDVEYLGTIGAVRYWKLNPIGPAASWTFN